MECLTAKDRIIDSVKQVRNDSFADKKHFTEEQIVNSFLDNLLDFKKSLSEKSFKINELNKSLESLTWINENMDDDCLRLINDLIAAMKDYHSTLIRHYVNASILKDKGIAKDEIKEFKNSIDDLKEMFIDFESIYFHLPQIPGFKETSKELSLI